MERQAKSKGEGRTMTPAELIELMKVLRKKERAHRNRFSESKDVIEKQEVGGSDQADGRREARGDNDVGGDMKVVESKTTSKNDEDENGTDDQENESDDSPYSSVNVLKEERAANRLSRLRSILKKEKEVRPRWAVDDSATVDEREVVSVGDSLFVEWNEEPDEPVARLEELSWDQTDTHVEDLETRVASVSRKNGPVVFGAVDTDKADDASEERSARATPRYARHFSDEELEAIENCQLGKKGRELGSGQACQPRFPPAPSRLEQCVCGDQRCNTNERTVQEPSKNIVNEEVVCANRLVVSEKEEVVAASRLKGEAAGESEEVSESAVRTIGRRAVYRMLSEEEAWSREGRETGEVAYEFEDKRDSRPSVDHPPDLDWERRRRICELVASKLGVVERYWEAVSRWVHAYFEENASRIWSKLCGRLRTPAKASKRQLRYVRRPVCFDCSSLYHERAEAVGSVVGRSDDDRNCEDYVTTVLPERPPPARNRRPGLAELVTVNLPHGLGVRADKRDSADLDESEVVPGVYCW
ncbi:unnamed protein product [Phytophthora fragariaefolia]|uniref:Unnamed protein product n=1 Tax=Phytophthora fragariaefolia TaxID=1490495 RepID=A0A9W7CYE5_9STRA|nr:unnamed protein product [Phytophthora fragariaefolia]